MSQGVLSENYSRDKFDVEFRKFVKRCWEIVAAHPDGDKSSTLHCLGMYMKVYDQTTPPEHFSYFETFFNQHRKELLEVTASDAWLRETSYSIQYAQGTQLESRTKGVRISLSHIYNMACDLRDQANKSLDDLTVTVKSWDLIYPEIFLYHFFKVLCCVVVTDDKERLLDVVRSLHQILHAPETLTDRATEHAPADAQAEAQQIPLNSIFSGIQNLLNQVGVPPPQSGAAAGGAAGFNPDMFGNIFQAVLGNNPAIQNVIRAGIEGLKSGKGFDGIIQAASSIQPEALGIRPETLGLRPEMQMHSEVSQAPLQIENEEGGEIRGSVVNE